MLFGQEIEGEYYDDDKVKLFELSYQTAFPIGNFGDAIDHRLHGFGLNYYVQKAYESTHFFGFSLNYMLLDRDINTLTNQGFPIERTVSSNLLNTDFLFRVYQSKTFLFFDPYLEVSLGAAFFYSNVVDQDLETDGNNIDVEEFDAALSYGVGLGSHIDLWGLTTLNLKFEYKSGTIASYLSETSEDFIDPLENFNLESSSIDHLKLTIGITFVF